MYLFNIITLGATCNSCTKCSLIDTYNLWKFIKNEKKNTYHLFVNSIVKSILANSFCKMH